LRNWCIWLVDSFESMMMHGLANPKFTMTGFTATSWTFVLFSLSMANDAVNCRDQRLGEGRTSSKQYGNETDGENCNTQRKTRPGAKLPNPKQTVLRMNPSLRVGKPTTKRLGHPWVVTAE
jgi:hypothetical protein